MTSSIRVGHNFSRDFLPPLRDVPAPLRARVASFSGSPGAFNRFFWQTPFALPKATLRSGLSSRMASNSVFRLLLSRGNEWNSNKNTPDFFLAPPSSRTIRVRVWCNRLWNFYLGIQLFERSSRFKQETTNIARRQSTTFCSLEPGTYGRLQKWSHYSVATVYLRYHFWGNF